MPFSLSSHIDSIVHLTVCLFVLASSQLLLFVVVVVLNNNNNNKNKTETCTHMPHCVYAVSY